VEKRKVDKTTQKGGQKIKI